MIRAAASVLFKRVGLLIEKCPSGPEIEKTAGEANFNISKSAHLASEAASNFKDIMNLCPKTV
jgi:hypothetical protein